MMQEMTAPERCARCGQARGQGVARVCVGCRAQENVARHIPPARRWYFWR